MNNTVILNNGIRMPRIGYGVYQIPSVIAEKCVTDALNLGYRSIDTAQCYGNEKQVGNAVKKSGIARDEIFVTTKLWGCRGYNDAVSSINSSLKALNLDCIDLLLIHEPTGDYIEIYHAMEKSYKDGKLRAIGVSNFSEDNFRQLITNCSIIPAVNQVETHIFRQQRKLHNLLNENGTIHEAWSPLACGRNGFFRNPTLHELASKYEKTTAQIGLRFLYQQDIVIIPKSTHIERMEENLDILDFELSEKEMNLLIELDLNKSLFGWW